MDTPDVSLTQDDRTTMLQPALDVSASLQQKFDRIFEKDQEYVVGAARPTARKPQLYVTDAGYNFLVIFYV
jgi:hypothetical protein